MGKMHAKYDCLSLSTLILVCICFGCGPSKTKSPANVAGPGSAQAMNSGTQPAKTQSSKTDDPTGPSELARSKSAPTNEPLGQQPTASTERQVLDLPSPESRSDPQKRREISQVTQEASVFVDALGELYPDDTDALEVRARYYLMLGRLLPAKQSWEKAIQLNPKYGYAYTGLGTVAMRDSDYDAAIRFLRNAVDLMPGEQNAAHELSNAYIKKGDIQSAIEVLQAQLTHKPNSQDTLQLLGQARLVNREYELAKDAFQRSLDLAPQNFMAQQGLSAALLRLGQREEAAKWIEIQRKARSNTNTPTEVAQAAERTDISTRLVQVARVFLKQSRIDLAQKALEYAIGCSDIHVESRTLLIQLLNQEKKFDAAMQLAMELIEIAPTNASYWLTAGTLSYRRRQLEEADRYFTKAIELSPERVEAYAAMTEAHIVLNGDNVKAMDMALKTTQLRGSASDFATYAQTLSINGRRDEAIEALRTAIEKDPEAENYKRILNSLQSANKQP